MSKSLELDKKLIWHPFEMPGSLPTNLITHGKGSILFTEDGKEIIDAISSWWVSIHGHSHPLITKALVEQANKLHHVMFAGFTHFPAVNLAERLISKLPKNQEKLFFSDNGSTAVEVALKLCIQFFYNQKEKRAKIIALENAYHGDTFGAMSAGSRSVFSDPFKDYLFEVEFLPSPANDPQKTILHLQNYLLKTKDVAAFIFEPLIQGAGGMNIYSPETLDSLIELCRQENIPCIADEVMTGFGRTTKWFASDHLVNPPDLICLSKGLTGGTLPLGITSCTKEIFNCFDSASKEKGFFHGHSFTGNPLSCSAAVASFDILNTTDCFDRIKNISISLQGFVEVLKNHPKIDNPRAFGTVLAFNIKVSESSGYLNPIRDRIISKCYERGVLIRPLGNVVYLMPSYCITDTQLLIVFETVLASLEDL